MIFLGLALLFLYAGLVLALIMGFRKLQLFTQVDAPGPPTGFSLVVPFRNEADQLPALLGSIMQLKYPYASFEVLLVDDFSEDQSQQVIIRFLENSQIKWTLLEKPKKEGSPKKAAIVLGVAKARHPWILTTDADCILPTTWLSTLDSFIRKHTPVLVAGPVTLKPGHGFLYHYQLFENLALQTTTIGGFGWNKPLMCNGANLAFKKEAFHRVKGYQGNTHLASGDDLFLMEKFQRAFPGRACFLKSRQALVRTAAESNWGGMLSQRLRWASKSGAVKSAGLRFTGLVLLSTNLWLVGALVYTLVVDPGFARLLIWSFGIKVLLDSILVVQASRLFAVRPNWLLVVPCGLLYPFLSSWTGLRSFFGGYNWKGRHHHR